MSVLSGMAMKWVAFLSVDGKHYMTSVVSTDYTGEQEARAKAKTLRDLFKSHFPKANVEVTLQQWEGKGTTYEL